jgi:hypothetical protein
MVSTVKVTNIDTPDNTGNITFDRPIVGDGSGLTGVDPTKAAVEALGIDVPAANITSGGTLPTLNGSALTGLKQAQAVYTMGTGLTSTTTTVPASNNTFSSSEGTQLQTVTLTPKSSSSKILVMAWGNMAHSAATTSQLAIFKDAETGAKAVAFNMDSQGSNVISPTTIAIWFETSGSTTARTYKVRYGPNSGTAYIGGRGNASIKNPHTHGIFAIEFI